MTQSRHSLAKTHSAASPMFDVIAINSPSASHRFKVAGVPHVLFVQLSRSTRRSRRASGGASAAEPVWPVGCQGRAGANANDVAKKRFLVRCVRRLATDDVFAIQRGQSRSQPVIRRDVRTCYAGEDCRGSRETGREGHL